MAQDMPAPVGHAVYAVGDGTVLESGADHGYGGVLVVLHKTGQGAYFKAVYGHVVRAARTAVGAKVKAGQVIGHVNSAKHVHFGIHPGRKYPPDNNPYRGHTYIESKTYGWVDPVTYLRANPRILTYAAPPVPVIATVETTARATVLGVAADVVYWSEGAAEQTATFSRALAGGDVAAVASETVLPAFDTTRFPAVVGGTTFTVADRLPRLTVASSSPAPSWKHSVTLSGKLASAAGATFTGATIVVETSTDGEHWSRLTSTRSGPSGSYALTFTPSRRADVRARFAPPDSAFLAVASPATTIAPKPALAAPVVPASADDGHKFTVSGAVTPRHTTGPGEVVLHVQRLTAGAWTDYTSAKTVYRDASSASLYRGMLTLPKGSYRVRADSPDDSRHAAAHSGWTPFTLR